MTNFKTSRLHLMVKPIIAPSILSGDFANIGEDTKKMLENGPDWLHVDVMDGNFVPNISFGPMVVAALRKAIPKGQAFFDCHMMVKNPQQWVKPIAEAGGDSYTFHLEADGDPAETIRQIKAAGMKASVAIRPGTPLSEAVPFLDNADMLLIMTVEPGFGGQKFMADMMDKVREARKLFPNLNVEVDGGIGPDNVSTCAHAGANVIVAGTSVYTSKDPKKTIHDMRQIVGGCCGGGGY